MQRDFGDEVLIAVVAIGVIAFAVVFGIILSLVSAPSAETVMLTPSTLVAAGETRTATDAVPTAMTAVVVASDTAQSAATSSITNVPTADDPMTETVEPDDITGTAAPIDTDTPTDSATDTAAAETDVPTLTNTLRPVTEIPTRAATEQSASVETATPEDTATDTGVPTATDTDLPTATQTNTAEPAATDTVEPSATNTELPTDTAEPTATDTVEPTVTNTDTPTATNTDAPTATNTDLPTPTSTDTATIPPTATETDLPTATTTELPTATNTATLTSTPPDTETPTFTPTDTATATNTSTLTSTATDTVTFTPTATNTATLTPIPTGTRDEDGACLYPEGFGRYMVNSGETLESLAEIAELPAEDLRGANCLDADVDVITGDILYLPLSTDATPTPDGTEAPWTVTGCTNLRLAAISSPAPGATLNGETPIIGTAFSPAFSGYRLELRPDAELEYEILRELKVPALQSVLGTLDVSDREPGLYWLRLVVETDADEFGQDAICVVPLFAP